MLSVVPLILNLVLIYFDLRVKSLFISFSLPILIVFSLPHFIYSISNNTYLDSTYLYVTVHACIFLSVYFIIRISLRHLANVKVSCSPLDDEEKYSTQQFNISLIFILVFIFISLSSFNFSLHNILISTWSESRNSSSGLDLLGSLFLYAGSSFALLVFKRRSLVGLSILFFLALYIVLALKTRNFLVALMVPVIIHFIIYTKWNVKKFIIGFLIISTVFLLYSGARNVRHIGSIDNIELSSGQLKIDTGEFELVNTLYYFVEKDGVNLDYDNVTLIRILSLPIPQTILPFERSKELSHILWDQKIGVKGVSGSLHATVIGDSILNSYYFGSILYGFLYAVIFFILEQSLRNTKFKVLNFGLFCTVSFYLARGAVYNGFIILIVGITILLSTSILIKITKRKQLE